MSKRDSTENFYEHTKIKKYLPKIKDEQVKYTGMPLTNHIGWFGATGSMKSNAFLNYLKRTSQPKGGTYTKILMLIKKIEPFNLLLKEVLQDSIQFYFNLSDFPDVSQFNDVSNKNTNYYCVVFDDFISEDKKANLKKLYDYLIYGRSKGCTVVVLSQSYYQTPILIRKQLSWICLSGIKSNKDLKSILNEYSLTDIDVHVLRKMYDYAKVQDFKDEPTFLKINTGVCPVNNKFSRNFLEYLNPLDFETKQSKSKDDSSDSDN